MKSYPYKDKLYEEIHKYLNKMEMTAPTKVLANFINALDKYIENVSIVVQCINNTIQQVCNWIL